MKLRQFHWNIFTSRTRYPGQYKSIVRSWRSKHMIEISTQFFNVLVYRHIIMILSLKFLRLIGVYSKPQINLYILQTMCVQTLLVVIKIVCTQQASTRIVFQRHWTCITGKHKWYTNSFFTYKYSEILFPQKVKLL